MRLLPHGLVNGGKSSDPHKTPIPNRLKIVNSLPHWISYWTYGFEMTVQWYFRRIRKLYSNIAYLSNAALPANTKPIIWFLTSWQMRWTEDILSGLRDIEEWDNVDWANDSVFLVFRSYVVENETRIERQLRKLKYYLDDANTLTIVAGEGRPEKVRTPCIVTTFIPQ